MKASFMILPMLLLSAKATPRKIVKAKPEAEPGSPGANAAESAGNLDPPIKDPESQ
jgi:hypothetical protein